MGEGSSVLTSASSRYHGLDFLRALMMSLGLVLHAAQLYLVMPIVDYYWDPMRSISMDVLLIFINTFRMPTFFMMSGFFTAMLFARGGLDGLMATRYQRFILPFIIFLPPLAIVMSALRICAYYLMETGQWGFNLALVPPHTLWDNTHNLWFLYYLIMFVLTAWLVIKSTVFLPESITRWFKRTVMQRSITSVRTITIAALLLAVIGSTSHAGRISANLSFQPELVVYLSFGVCFFLGWMLFQRVDDLTRLAKRCWTAMGFALLSLLLGLAGFAFQGEPNSQHYAVFHWVLSIGTGFSIVFFMLGFVGIFNRYFSQHNKWIRYFSDSAYWVFIFHSIPLVIFAMPLYFWDVPAELKFLVVLVATISTSLLTYQLWVRESVIGKLLNGQRYHSVPWRES